MNGLFDAYTLKARALPAAMILLPIFTTALLCYPSLMDSRFFLPLSFIAVAVISVMANVVRTWGKKEEPTLFKNWGGIPSVILLRESDRTLESKAKYRYRQFLANQLSNIVMPSPAVETRDPDFADRQYLQASNWLLSNTRDIHKYPLIHAENINYGYRRNMYASKIPAICICQAAIVFSAVFIFEQWARTHEITHTLPLINIALQILLLIAWALGVTKGWVKETAFEFARQLITACDNTSLHPTS